MIDGVVSRYHGSVEHHVVAARRSHAEVIPGFDDLDPRRVARYEERAHEGFGVVGPRPHREPAQSRDSGRIDLAASQTPITVG